MRNTDISIIVDDQHAERFSEIVEKCKQAGLKVGQEMEATGVITGSIDPARIDDLMKIEGVSHVEQSRKIGIAPPDSKIQ